MSDDRIFTINATPRKWKRKPNNAGFDPIISGRAPAPLIKAIKDKASARNVTVGVIIREALAQYVGNSEGRERAA
jgi:predicted DNA binding CopG/RHH family protein